MKDIHDRMEYSLPLASAILEATQTELTNLGFVGVQITGGMGWECGDHLHLFVCGCAPTNRKPGELEVFIQSVGGHQDVEIGAI